ncbi:MAG TPA: tetratricopeptide repeat protein [Thermoanaerobaculia bacterium]|nr:tetratricopeptide repeat protein [Thermoanaerobaculia bacterium]
MTPASVDWLPGAAMLLSGIILGVMMVWHVRKSAPPGSPISPTVSLEMRDLLGKRDSLLEQLREMDDISSKRSSEQLASERAALELETAKVLQALDERRRVEAVDSAPPALAIPSPGLPLAEPKQLEVAAAPPGKFRGFIWGAGTSAALALLIIFVGRSVSDRKQGDSMTGDLPKTGSPSEAGGPPFSAGGRSEPVASDSKVKELESAIAARPDNTEARLELARLQLERQQLMEVFKQTQSVLEREPHNARALAMQSIVRLEMGRPDEALAMLKRATASDPDLIEASVYLAIVYTELGRSREAADTIRDAAKRHPEHAEKLNGLLADIRARASMASAALGPARAEAAAPGPGGSGVSGSVTLGSSTSLPRGATLFIIVRPAGVTTGPPIAAKRISPESFPATFTIGAADSMMGQAIPASIRLEVRADSDGDPVTRDPGDPTAVLDPVSSTAGGVSLVLR